MFIVIGNVIKVLIHVLSSFNDFGYIVVKQTHIDILIGFPSFWHIFCIV